MSDHLAVCVDRLIAAETLDVARGSEVPRSLGGSNGHTTESSGSACEESEKVSLLGEEEPLIPLECRICQEEDSIKNMEVPCTCNGNLKFAHRECVQKWCNEKGDTVCEICHQPYQPGYTAPPPPPADETAINISSQWTVSGAPLDLNDPRLLAMAAAERRQVLEAEYNEYGDAHENGAAFCRFAALIFMAMLILMHALYTTNPYEFFLLRVAAFLLPCYIMAWVLSILQRQRERQFFLLRVADFLLPCYIMAWALSMLQRRREREEAATLTAGEVTYMIQAGQNREVCFTLTPGAAVSVAHHPEPQQ